MIDLGLCWRIGDGKSVCIREDKWLPKIPTARLISPAGSLPQSCKVSELIEEEAHLWRSDLIRSEFLSFEASMILRIPLSCQGQADKQIWLPTQNGTYSTRSAYKLLAGVDRSTKPNCSSSEKTYNLWSGIWGLQVPQKVKHLLWRASHNSLPTLCNLRRRNVVQVAVYPRCKSDEEDTLHALWYCPSLFEVWSDDAVIKKALRYKFQEFSDLLGMVLLLRDRIDLNLLVICFWMIWTKRNSDKIGEPYVEFNRIQTKAKLLLHDFCTAQQPKNPRQVVDSRVVRWIPLIPPSLKINFDGACFKEMGTTGMGVVVRDCAGSVLGALSQRI